MTKNLKRLLHLSILAGLLCLSSLLVRPAMAQDLTTMLSKFLVDLRAGTLGVNNLITSIKVGDGLVGTPSIAFASETGLGFYRKTTGEIGVANANGSTPVFVLAPSKLGMGSGTSLLWGSAAAAANSGDTLVGRAAAGAVLVSNATTTSTAELQVSGGNGGFLSNVKALTELTTIAAAATTATTIQIPVNAVTLAVSVRVVTVIPTAATFTVTSATPAKTWNTVAVPVAATTTDAGTAPGPTFQTTASVITITPNLTPGAATGQVRVTIYYYQVTPSTS